MILSASRRCDVPAFHTPWLLARLQAGFAGVRNPMNPRQVSLWPTAPEAVDALVLWSKNPAPLLPHLDMLAGYTPLIQYTLTAYPPSIEPGLPPTAERIAVFQALAAALGPERLIWRYDPICYGPGLGRAEHVAAFAALAGQLAGRAGRCVISFLDDYAAVRGALAARGLYAPDPAEQLALASALSPIARRAGMAISACCEAVDLTAAGVSAAPCIDRAQIEALCGRALRAGKDPGQRPKCGCARSVDLGAYEACPHGCVYCYAKRPGRRFRPSDPAWETLCGPIGPLDRVTDHR